MHPCQILWIFDANGQRFYLRSLFVLGVLKLNLEAINCYVVSAAIQISIHRRASANRGYQILTRRGTGIGTSQALGLACNKSVSVSDDLKRQLSNRFNDHLAHTHVPPLGLWKIVADRALEVGDFKKFSKPMLYHRRLLQLDTHRLD